MLQNVKAVIFDLDGTLIDSMWMWEKIDMEYLGGFGITLLPQSLKREIEGMSFTETAKYFKKRFQIPDSVEKMKETWNHMAYDKYKNEVPLKEGVLLFLEQLKTKGIKLGIATSNSKLLAQSVLQVHGIDTYFQVVKTACDVSIGKPSPDIYLKAANELGVHSKECLVFEDVPMGILAGKNANMKVCAVYDAFSEEQKEEKCKLADYYIHTFAEVLEGTFEVLVHE